MSKISDYFFTKAILSNDVVSTKSVYSEYIPNSFPTYSQIENILQYIKDIFNSDVPQSIESDINNKNMYICSKDYSTSNEFIIIFIEKGDDKYITYYYNIDNPTLPKFTSVVGSTSISFTYDPINKTWTSYSISSSQAWDCMYYGSYIIGSKTKTKNDVNYLYQEGLSGVGAGGYIEPVEPHIMINGVIPDKIMLNGVTPDKIMLNGQCYFEKE